MGPSLIGVTWFLTETTVVLAPGLNCVSLEIVEIYTPHLSKSQMQATIVAERRPVGPVAALDDPYQSKLYAVSTKTKERLSSYPDSVKITYLLEGRS